MTVTAPYSFVPLSNEVFLPDDLPDKESFGAPSQDDPIHGGLSGTIPFTLTCKTPLLVGGANGDRSFMTTPDGCPAIPGSSPRGMVRNVMEIATFGKMQLVDDQRVAVRDLQKGARMDYGDRMAGWDGSAFAPRSFW